MDAHAHAAVEQVGRIEELIEDLDEQARDRGGEFFDGVLEKARSIAETIEAQGRVSEKQAQALDNMEAAVRRWIH